MQDNTISGLLGSRIVAGIAAYNTLNPSNPWTFNGAPFGVSQKNDPTQEGVQTSPTVFFQRLFDFRYGWPMVEGVYVPPVAPAPQGTFDTTESQWIETTFQVSALVMQDPTNLTLPTAADVVNYVAQWLQSRASIKYFAAQNVTMYRASSVRGDWFVDERELYEMNPNFDICLQHTRELLDVVPATNIVQGAKIEGIQGAGTFPV